MNLKLLFWQKCLLIFVHQNAIIKAALFAFLIEEPTIFRDCENEPDYLGAADMMDLSNLKIDFLDGSVHMEGSITMLWDADPDDRVELKVDVFKYERGGWQPTVFTLIQKDFCTALFNENEIYYQTWAKYVEEDDLKCITNKGHTYHHIPFDLETLVDIQGTDISGRHKIGLKIDAYNQDYIIGVQPNSVCLEVVGDIIKK